MSVARLSLQEAKDRLSIFELWRLLSLPGSCKRQPCRTPWRKDKRPSLSIYDGGRHFKDHATGQGGDVIDFLVAAADLDLSEATRRFIAMAGGAGYVEPAALISKPQTAEPGERGKPVLPANAHHGDESELRRLAALRGLSVDAIRLADARGLLLFGKGCGQPSWIVTDATRCCAQARRLDGHLYPAFEHISERKAHTIKGSSQSWPIGSQEAANYPIVALVEGAPDLLAGCHFVCVEERTADVAVVAMLGAANYIHEHSLAWLSGKRVRIYPHTDEAGRAAAVRWACQLESAGCHVDALNLAGLRRSDGQPVNDLNDLAQLDADAFENERGQLERILP